MTNFRDGNLVQGQNFGNVTSTVALTETFTEIDPGYYGIVNIYSDSSTAINRQIGMAPGEIEGQVIMLNFMSEAPFTCLMSTIVNSYTRIISSWTPQQYDKLQLVWTSGTWQEVSRSAFSDGTVVPIVSFNPTKWQSFASVQSFGAASYAVMSGYFLSLTNSNTTSMGILPAGYHQTTVTAEKPGVFMLADGSYFISNIILNSNVLYISPTANINDRVYVDSFTYAI